MQTLALLDSSPPHPVTVNLTDQDGQPDAFEGSIQVVTDTPAVATVSGLNNNQFTVTAGAIGPANLTVSHFPTGSGTADFTGV